MPSASKMLFTLTLLTVAYALPTPQLAGTGAAADSILSSTDNGVGYGIENAEDNTAALLSSTLGGSGSGSGSAAPAPAPAPAPRPPHRRRQLAGTGAAANSLLSSTDNGVGYGIKNAEDNVAALIGSVKGGVPAVRRQLAGTGAAANSLLSSTDNGVGYGIENAENNVAALVSSVKGGVPAPPRTRRQLDKISNGLQAVSNAAGTGSATSALTSELDTIDGQSTGGQADLGAQIGNAESSTLESLGKAIPKRQLDKVSNGLQAVSNAAGTGSATSALTSELDTVDGQSTGGQADLGAQVGNAESSTLESLGKAIPKRQLDKVSKGLQAVSNAAGTGALTSATTNGLVDADGTTTSGQANTGAALGSAEEGTLEAVGSSVPTSLTV
jgi:hypothetical protein